MIRTEPHPNPGRYLPLAGPVFTTLLVLGAAAFPTPPGGDVSPASAPQWMAAHQGAVIGQTYLRALAAVAFLALTAAVVAASRRELSARSSLPAVAMVGGALTGGLMLAAQATTLAAALYVKTAGHPEVTRALGALQNGLLDMSALPAVLLFAATGLAGLHTGFLPRWFALLSLAGVPLALVDAASYDGGPLESVGMLGLVYFLAWSLIIGVRLHLAHPVDRATTAPTEPVRTA